MNSGSLFMVPGHLEGLRQRKGVADLRCKCFGGRGLCLPGALRS